MVVTIWIEPDTKPFGGRKLWLWHLHRKSTLITKHSTVF